MKSVPLHKVAGLAREIRVGDKTYLLAQVNVNVLAQAEMWAKEQPFARLSKRLELCGKQLPLEVVTQWAADAAKESESKDAMQKEIESIAGIRKILWWCFLEAQPITEAEYDEIIQSIGLDALKDFLEKDNGLEAIDSEPPSTGDGKKK